jgi:hypothetical protein
MTDADIKRRIREKVLELVREMGKRDRANVRIVELQRDIKALRIIGARDALANKSTEQPLVGFTEAIRSIMRITGKPMTAGQVKDALSLIGYDFGSFSNPAAAVHNTLKRMADTGELSFDKDSKNYAMRNPLEGK